MIDSKAVKDKLCELKKTIFRQVLNSVGSKILIEIAGEISRLAWI